MVKALFWTAWLHSLKRIISLQVHVSAWNSGVSSQGATVPMPAVRTGGCFACCHCHVWSLCCVLGFQCLQGHELEAPHHILARELLSEFPCVWKTQVDCAAALLGKEIPCLSWPLPGSWGPETLIYFFNIAAEYLFKAGVHILREKPFWGLRNLKMNLHSGLWMLIRNLRQICLPCPVISLSRGLAI